MDYFAIAKMAMYIQISQHIARKYDVEVSFNISDDFCEFSVYFHTKDLVTQSNIAYELTKYTEKGEKNG